MSTVKLVFIEVASQIGLDSMHWPRFQVTLIRLDFLNEVFLEQENVKKSEKLMKIDNIDKKNRHIFLVTREISIKFSERNVLW